MDKNPTVVFTAPKKVEIEYKEIPRPGAGELLARTRRSMISSGTELSVLEAGYEPGSKWEEWTTFPCYPGYCNVAEVVDAGQGVDRGWIGKRIAAPGPHAMYFTWSADGAPNMKANLICRDIGDDQAVFYTLASIVMNSIRRAGVKWGEAVVVYGLGLIGQLAVQFLRISGARPVIAADISDSRLNRLSADPAVIAVNPKTDNVAEIVKANTKGRMADVVFEATGVGALIPQEFAALRKQGRFIVLSAPRGSTKFDFHDLCCVPSYTIIGTHNSSHPSFETLDYPWTAERDAELFFDLVADGEAVVDGLISHKEHYAKAPELYNMLLEDRSRALGVILDWGAE